MHIHSSAPGRQPNEIVYITWTVTSTCNFSCSYCSDELHDKEYKFPEIDGALHFINTIVDGLPKNAYVCFSLTGGEPTLWPKLITFLNAVKKIFKNKTQDIIISIDTNLSRTNRYWQELANKDLWDILVLHASYHAEECDPDLFYSNLEIISNKYMVNASLMLEPSNFKNIVVLAKRIQQSLPVDTIIKVIRPKFNPHNLHAEYTDEMLDYIRDIKKNRFYFDRVKFSKDENKEPAWPQKMYVNNKRVSFQQMIVKKEHNFKGYKCSAGSLRFFIEPNGDIFPCTRLTTSRKIAADGTTKRDHTTKNPYLMGNINERNFKIYDKYITCPVDWCPCLPDALADKYKINTVS